MVTRRELFLRARTAIPVENAAFEARELLYAALHITREEYYLYPSTEVSDAEAAYFLQLLEKRVSGVPLAHLIGEWDFYGRTFKITPDVLIPRPETEEVVKTALEYLTGGERILDLCSGSGCIGITLALELPSAQVVMGDISDAACRIAAENIRRFGVKNIAVRYEDASLPPSDPQERFHLIVSNPPYIGLHEHIDREVRDYEPSIALFGGEDGLDFYRAIAAYRLGALYPGGHLILECGEKQAHAVATLLHSAGASQARIVYDLSGKARVIVAEK